MSDSVCYIYTLADSIDSESIRYVGQTVLTLPKRLNRHINSCSCKSTKITYKDNWIKSLLNQGRTPEIKLIETINSDDISLWNAREIYWISFYKSLGHRLTNSSLGGRGGRWSEEMKKKASKTRKGRAPSEKCLNAATAAKLGKHRTDETKKKISDNRKGIEAWNKGVPATDEVRHRLQTMTIGYKHTEESKKKISEASKEMWSDEEKRKQLIENITKSLQLPEARHKAVESSRKIWEDKAYREKVSNALREAWKKRKEERDK